MFPYCHRTSPAQSQWRSMMSALQDHHRDQAQRRSRPWHLRDEQHFGQWDARGSPASAGGRAHCTRPWRQERAAKRAPPAMLTGRYTGFHSFPQITATGSKVDRPLPCTLYLDPINKESAKVGFLIRDTSSDQTPSVRVPISASVRTPIAPGMRGAWARRRTGGRCA